MQDWLNITILAILQGATEFLPVSSSGHLLILGKLLGIDPDLNLSIGIYLHAGSLLAIGIFYSKLLLDFLKQRKFRLFLMLIAATVPAAIAGVTLRLTGADQLLLSSPLATAMAFLITGMILKMTDKPKLVPPQEQAVDLDQIRLPQAMIIGLVQMGAILPGISRSGSTISAALFCGIKREAAATFSFLLALPAIAGATFIELLKHFLQTETRSALLDGRLIVFAVLLSFAVSIAALSLMVRVVKKGKLSRFSWYLFAAGTAVFIWQFIIYNGVK